MPVMLHLVKGMEIHLTITPRATTIVAGELSCPS